MHVFINSHAKFRGDMATQFGVIESRATQRRLFAWLSLYIVIESTGVPCGRPLYMIRFGLFLNKVRYSMHNSFGDILDVVHAKFHLDMSKGVGFTKKNRGRNQPNLISLLFVH